MDFLLIVYVVKSSKCQSSLFNLKQPEDVELIANKKTKAPANTDAGGTINISIQNPWNTAWDHKNTQECRQQLA